MNSTIASNINGGISNQQVANGSHSSLLLSSIEFSLTEIKTNFSTPGYQGKYLKKLTGKEELLNGQNKVKISDNNKNSIENSSLSVNGNDKQSAEDSLPVPKVQLYTGKISVEWNQVHKIGAGLNNLGNTCFMNTVIQCLTYCPPLANYLLHDNDHMSKCTVTGFCMMCLLQKHIRRAIGKTGEVIKPFEVYQRLRSIAKHFQFGRQEDAHEFLRYVIDHLWKSCLPQTNGVTKLDAASKETTVINRIFGGYHRSQVICLRCKKTSNTYDHFMDFILDIKQNVMTLEKALEKFIQPELLQQENCYKCPKCKMKVEAQKRFTVFRAPTVATFQLKRFDYNRSLGGKITKQITYPEKLNLRPYMSENKGDPVWYCLNAVLVHSGMSCNSGHYYCYVKNSNGFWYIMDDSRVHQVGLNQVLNQGAYVLFYIKMENSEKAPLKKCFDIKNSLVKGVLSNSHFSKVSEVGNLKSVIPLSEKISPFSNSKVYNSSSNGIKKFNNISTLNREKISFGFRTNASSTALSSSPKNKMNSSEPVSATTNTITSTTTRGGLVPYVEDSSESSDASDSNLPQGRSDGRSPLSKNSASNESHRLSPQLQIRAKLSKSVFSTPSRSSASCSPTPKVNATGSWIVTDAPETVTRASSSSSGVSSTTDWQVIEASNLKSSSDSPKVNGSCKDSSSKLSTPEGSPSSKLPALARQHSLNNDSNKDSNEVDALLSSVKKTSGECDQNSGCGPPSAQNCNFRKQIHQSETHFPGDEETASGHPCKRKHCDSRMKVSEDTPSSPLESDEGRHSPVPKKAKCAENCPLILSRESDIRNSCAELFPSQNGSDFTVQKQYANSDNNSRTCVLNGVSSSAADHSKGSLDKNSSILLNGCLERKRKDSMYSKGKQDDSYSESKVSSHHEKEKMPMSNQGKNAFLYGTEVPTWRGEDRFRPSILSPHEKRRSFDSYDNEFDSGKIRKSKMKDQYQYFNKRNPFQKQADRHYGNGKYNGKFYNNHSYRKYDSCHKWKSNHSDNNYRRYRNHHRRY